VPGDPDIVELTIIHVVKAVGAETISEGTPYGFRSRQHEAKAALGA
jgi:hypothetical protein